MAQVVCSGNRMISMLHMDQVVCLDRFRVVEIFFPYFEYVVGGL
jgi:hypothetical protein